ncbi:phosphotransferase family protein [Bacillus sp. B1-b2]|uniref:phosphotransferase family protein n=1 Tax=Bacillus sp. B1-b2 TaxID=2653201 RepID=UPI001261C08B|nr:phosphotransferase family protein [Bacillus sp. B1-b2]KAB7666786.1 phosphotransferase family protein [Bacillus sp. B1-b2]
MEHLLGQDWEITPAGGETGEAFFAQNNGQKLFLKRNSSPFLAVLSAEGIVPKLVWTKRFENGDVFTAQQWLIGREFGHSDMKDNRVTMLLKKIHTSKPLLEMLRRLGKTSFHPEMILAVIKAELDDELKSNKDIMDSIRFMEENLSSVKTDEHVVCHCDVNHNNWLLSEDNQLYLIDWDGAMIADPAIDIGMLLYWYIPKEEWQNWLHTYGYELTNNLALRMKWYVIAQTINSIRWYKKKGRYSERDRWLQFLHDMD